MKAILGQYHYAPHRRHWGVWQWTEVSENGASARFIKDVFSYEDAVREVYRLNGWGTPKQIRRSY